MTFYRFTAVALEIPTVHIIQWKRHFTAFEGFFGELNERNLFYFSWEKKERINCSFLFLFSSISPFFVLKFRAQLRLINSHWTQYSAEIGFCISVLKIVLPTANVEPFYWLGVSVYSNCVCSLTKSHLIIGLTTCIYYSLCLCLVLLWLFVPLPLCLCLIFFSQQGFEWAFGWLVFATRTKIHAHICTQIY